MKTGITGEEKGLAAKERKDFWGKRAMELRGQLRSQMEFGNEGNEGAAL